MSAWVEPVAITPIWLFRNHVSQIYNNATVFPERVEPTRPNDMQPFSGGEILSRRLMGMPRDLESTFGTEAIKSLI
jgi:hypothetical protein